MHHFVDMPAMPEDWSVGKLLHGCELPGVLLL